MKRKNVRKFFIVGCLVVALAMAVLVVSGCQKKSAEEVAQATMEEKETIRWRLQSYAGPALNEHVCLVAMKEFNIAANN